MLGRHIRRLGLPLLAALVAGLVVAATGQGALSRLLACGGNFILGATNTCNGTTSLTGSVDGNLLSANNTNAGSSAIAINGTVSNALAAVRGINNGSGQGLRGSSNSGIGVLGTSTNGTGVVGTHSAATGSLAAVRGDSLSASNNAVGVLGRVLPVGPGVDSAGVKGQNLGTNGNGSGVFGSHAGSGSGVRGTSVGGVGVLGAHGAAVGTAAGVEGDTNSTASSAVGVLGTVTATSPGGFSAGVRGINNGTGGLGIGVYGSQAGSGWGVYGQSPSGIGVRGESVSGTAVDGSSGSGTGVAATNNSSSGPALKATNNDIGPAAAFVSGGAPFTVNSSTKVENLNADQLDGRSANELVRAGRATNITYLNGGTFVERLTISIDAPSDGFVLVTGAISVNTLVGGATDCNPCIAVMRLRNPADSALSPEQVATFGNGSSEQGDQLATSWIFPVTAGTRTFALDALATGTAGTVFFDNPTLTALFVPFGATGAGTLGPLSPPAEPRRRH